ncbi:uncharacterized protein LOC135212173 [Macrobrachium nipponense]|uniref:uncharacterized protein LOC135212173 n=1 Tax=Macrobrachium nipponense TaxID=159736 RepID=UPI0030C8514C
METKDDKWVCKASDQEKLHEISHKRGSFLLAYQLSLSSIQPLQESHVKTALIHFQRKCQAFQICFGQRDGQTWLRYRDTEDIDFKVVKDVGPDYITDLLHIYQYNSEEGPLWCARLLLDTDADSLALDKDLAHTSQLFIGVHHAITDGLSMLKVCGGLIKILNDVIANKPISDEEHIGYFVSDTKTEELVALKMTAIQNDPSLKQELISRAEEKGVEIPLLLTVEPPPEGEDKTCNLTRVLDKNTTKRFISRCKAEGVSIHSAFAALADASIVTLLVEKNNIQNSYKMCNGHIINLRRYWTGDCSDAMGCHARGPLNLWTDVPRDLSGKFWDFARTLHRDLHRDLENESILFQMAYIKLCSKKDQSYDDIFYQANPMQIDCVFSNLGDVTDLLTDDGPYVRPYLLKRHLSLHRTDIKNFAYFFHSFRGRLILNLLYNSKYVAKAVAQQHCSQIFDTMEKVINGTFH